MGRRARRRLRKLATELARQRPELNDVERLIAEGCVLVDRRIVTNPASLVPVGAPIAVRPRTPLRGEAKLRAALAGFDVRIAGRVALDLGAAAGGFTRVLLRAGAARVYAVDAGHGQLVSSLRQDPRVVNLERVNVGLLTREHVPETVEVVTIDLSYLAIARAVPQLDDLVFSREADLVALVKPMFELGLPSPPTAAQQIRAAVRRAERGLAAAGWEPCDTIESPVRGSRGAIEWLVHARRMRQ